MDASHILPQPSRSLAILLGAALLWAVAAAQAQWQRVEASPELLATLFDATVEPVPAPGCADGSPFSFFVYPGPDLGGRSQLLLGFDGGGACWDTATCVGSLQPGARPTYSPALGETVEELDALAQDLDGSGAGGILAERPDNPFFAFARVLVPYCTGDIHLGSADTLYPDPVLCPQGCPVRHRGADNLRVVLRWLGTVRAGSGPFAQIAVAGSSAGGYGALLQFPAVRAALGEESDYALVVDSANAVLTDGFLDRVFGPGDLWGVTAAATLDPRFLPAFALPAADLPPALFATLAAAYPDLRMAQTTRAFDAVQSAFLWAMQASDAGTYDPFAPPDPAAILLTAVLDWSPRARLAMRETAALLPNYRFYEAAGWDHVLLLDGFFEEDSAQQVPLPGWVDDALRNPGPEGRWHNLSCFPYCLPYGFRLQ